MLHYGFINRQRKILTVKFYEKRKIKIHHNKFSDWKDIVKSSNALYYEDCLLSHDGAIFHNVIMEDVENDKEIVEWEGIVHHSPLNPNEILTIGDKKYHINKVEKNVNGSVTYCVDDLIIKDEKYNKLLEQYKLKLDRIFESKKPIFINTDSIS